MGTSVRKNLYWNTLLRIPIRIISFFFSIYIARLLDPADFGIMAITMMCIGYANFVTNFGLNEAIIQQSITCKKTINAIFTIDIAISICLAAIFTAGAGIIAEFFHEERSLSVIRLMSLVFIITSFSGIPTVLLRRDNNFKMLAWLEMSQSLAISVLTLLLAIFHFNYWALAYGQLVPLLIFTIVVCVQAKWVPGLSFQFKLLKPILHFGFWSFLKSQTAFLVSHIEKIIVGRMLGSYPLGIYDKAKSIAIMPYDSFLMNINAVMFSAYCANKKDNKLLSNYFAKSLFIISIFAFPIYSGFILLSSYFVQIFLGDKWMEMVLPLQVVLMGYLFKSFSGMLTSLNISVGRYREHTQLTILSGVLLLALSFFFIWYGILGMAFAFLIFCIIEFLFYAFLSFRSLNLNIFFFFRYVFVGAWSSIVMFFVVRFLTIYYLEAKTFLNLVLIVFAGILVYLTCLLVDKSRYLADFKRSLYNDLGIKRRQVW